MRQTPPIAVQIVALVLAAVALATVALFAVTFRGPPPMPAPVTLSDLRALLLHAEALPSTVQEAAISEGAAPPIAPAGLERLPLAERMLVPGGVARVWGRDGRMTVRELRGAYVAAVRLPDGVWRVATSRAQPWFTAWHRTTLLVMLALLAVLGAAAWWLARAITRPLEGLAASVASIEGGVGSMRATVDGPPEVRRLAAALNAMRDRVVATLASRTDTLAAITHDLSTPLSRLAFRVEALVEPQRRRAQADIGEMHGLIASVLEYARGEATVREPVALVPLLERVVADAQEEEKPVRLRLRGVAGEPRVLATGAGMRRLIDNLVANALRFATTVELGLVITWDEAIVTVTDDGPGLPPHLGERLFEPFVRGEASRNRATGGAGLGLAIARNIAEGAGGRLMGETRAEGGARFTLALPLMNDEPREYGRPPGTAQG